MASRSAFEKLSNNSNFWETPTSICAFLENWMNPWIHTPANYHGILHKILVFVEIEISILCTFSTQD